MLSERIKKVPANHALAEAHFRCAANPWAPENPEGCINLGTAEHAMLCPAMSELLKNAPVALEEDLRYQCLHGKYSARQKIAQWLSLRAGRQLDPEKVVLASGATAIIEALGFALCDPGDYMLIPAPCYSGFHYDLESRAQVQLEYIPCWAKDGFALLPENIESVFKQACSQGKKIKALLLHSPANPVGRIYTASELRAYSDFCFKAGISLVVDEVCSDTSFDLSQFVSALKLEGDHVHVIHSLGKGYGMAGLASGFFYSDNAEMVQAVACQACFARMPNHLQSQIVWLLEHHDISQILERSCRQLYGVANDLVNRLGEIGIKSAPPQAGVFIWSYLGAAAGVKSFSDERRVFEQLMVDSRLNISPGQFFNAFEPGWFRLCFSVPEPQLSTAVQRLARFIESRRNG